MDNKTRETHLSIRVQDLLGYLYDRQVKLETQQRSAKTLTDLSKNIGGCDEVLALLQFLRNYDHVNTRKTQDSVATLPDATTRTNLDYEHGL